MIVMTIFEKAYWNTSGDNISILMPISKVDAEKRIVSGWATTDAVDKQGDIVSIDASEKAFDKFRGNVREQHTPLAVGKVISFKRDKYFDKESGEIHNGIFVDVYVSKGAEDTWHKVNEKILTGFSIGGKINDTEEVYAKGANGPVRMIKDYDLFELSLVDNPANPDSNFVSIQKFSDNTEVVEKNYLENVYWCNSNEVVIISEKSQYNCPDCNSDMTNIGFVESRDTAKAQTINDLIKSFCSPVSDETSDNMAIDEVAKSIADNDKKEGSNVGILKNKKTTEEIVEKSDDVVEDAPEEVVEEEAAEAEEVVEEATEDVEEVEKSTTPEDSNVEDLAKAVDEIKTSVAEAVDELVSAVKSIAEKVADLTKSVNGVSEDVSVVKGNVEEFGQRVDAIEADTAVRKSGDLGGIVQEQKIEKSKWGGRFLKAADIYR